VAQFRKASIRLSKPAPIEVNYEINYDQVNIDFITQMSRLKESNPDGIILWADPVPAGILVKKIREIGITIPVVACERILNPAFIREAGSAAEGVVATSPFNPESESPKFVEFKKKYKERFAADPDMYAAYSYDGANMVIAAIHQAGLNRYRIRDAMALQQDWEGVTGICHYDDVFTNRSPVTVATVKDGKWVYGIPKLENVF
jgi:branched-chain amino acid transport system substrate-binding protein